jgi:type II secretory pathway component PulF
MSMKRPFRITWKEPTGETTTVNIEAESKGQARRIFIQRGGNILRIVEIEDSQERAAGHEP